MPSDFSAQGDAAGTVLRSLSPRNHFRFVDGNKRVTLSAALVFLKLNGYEIEDPEEKLYDLMMSVAAGEAQKGDIAAVFRRLSRPEEPE